MADLNQMALVAEQLRHTLDLIRADISEIRAELEHFEELTDTRLERIEKSSEDHEGRIRDLRDSAQQTKTWMGLATGGNSLVSILAIISALSKGVF